MTAHIADVTIDAGVLVVPGGDAGAEDAHGYVEALLDWASLMDEPWIAIVLSDKAADCLSWDDLYPFRGPLGELFSRNGVVEYDANTVSIVIERLLRQTPTLETHYGIDDVLTEDCQIEPNILRDTAGHRLKADLERCLVLMAILRCCDDGNANPLLAIRLAPTSLVRVRALIEEVAHGRDDIDDCVPLAPKYFEGDVRTCDSLGSLLECIDERSVLRDSGDDFGVEAAIRIGLYKNSVLRSGNATWGELARMRMGAKFGELVRQWCGNGPGSLASSILRAIVAAVERENPAAVHPLRISAGGNSAQRRRAGDNARAWRRKIDDNMRLHYWELADGGLELASVGPHNSYSIPE